MDPPPVYTYKVNTNELYDQQWYKQKNITNDCREQLYELYMVLVDNFYNWFTFTFDVNTGGLRIRV